jgi:hypothetical protein
VGGELVNADPSPRLTYTQQFEEHFPYYLALGMTYEDYWRRDPCLVKYYRQAERIRTERVNYEAWLQGAYIYDALCFVSPILHAFAEKGTQPMEYLKKPYAIGKEKAEQERKAQEEERLNVAADNFTIFAKAFNKKFREKQEQDVERND